MLTSDNTIETDAVLRAIVNKAPEDNGTFACASVIRVLSAYV